METIENTPYKRSLLFTLQQLRWWIVLSTDKQVFAAYLLSKTFQRNQF